MLTSSLEKERGRREADRRTAAARGIGCRQRSITPRTNG